VFALVGVDNGGDYDGGSVGLYFFQVLYWEVKVFSKRKFTLLPLKYG